MRFVALYQFTGELAGFALIGWLIDQWLEISPWGLLCGMGLGLVSAFYHLLRTLQPRK